MEKVTLKPIYHHSQECIGVYFNYKVKLNNAVRKINGIRWSKTNNCLYTSLSKNNYEATVLMFNGLAITDNTALKVYLNEKQKAIAQTANSTIEIPPNKLRAINARKLPGLDIVTIVKPTITK